ncbi:MAG: hypothetical protein MPJ53_00035 [Alphaproteobacteria bacterium]|nr:hypothetical protein [Alphaproteobacteria bacterium]
MSLFRASANSPRVRLGWLAACLHSMTATVASLKVGKFSGKTPASAGRREIPAKLLPEPDPVKREAQLREVRANFTIFREKHLQRLLAEGYRDKYALMHNGEIIEIINTEDLYTAVFRGEELLGDKPFSTQKITDEVVCI